MATSLNTKELVAVLDATPAEQNIMLVGKHGIGKSEILTKYYEAKGMKVVALFLGQMADPGDLIGLPHKNEETGKTEFMPPYWFPVDGQPIVLFLDELNRARPELLQTVMDLALNRKLAGRYLPDGSRIISAVNDGEEYQITDLDPALVSRFNIYNFRPTYQEWLMWADKVGVDERVTSFISENPKALEDMGKQGEDNGLDKTPDRRAWKKVSDIIKGKSELGETMRKVVGGIIGVTTCSLFFQSLGTSRLVSAKDILLNYDKVAKAISKYKLHDMCTIGENVFRFIENGIPGDFDQKVCKANLTKFFDNISKMKEAKEAFGYLINLAQNGMYPKTFTYLITNLLEVYSKMERFILDA